MGRSFGKASHYWISANDFDTMYSLFNPTDRAQDFIATIYYSDGSGSYQMPVHLEAQASTMIDMMMLIGEKRPDVHGNVIPASVRQGSMVIENPKGKDQWMTLVVSWQRRHGSRARGSLKGWRIVSVSPRRPSDICEAIDTNLEYPYFAPKIHFPQQIKLNSLISKFRIDPGY